MPSSSRSSPYPWLCSPAVSPRRGREGWAAGALPADAPAGARRALLGSGDPLPRVFVEVRALGNEVDRAGAPGSQETGSYMVKKVSRLWEDGRAAGGGSLKSPLIPAGAEKIR